MRGRFSTSVYGFRNCMCRGTFPPSFLIMGEWCNLLTANGRRGGATTRLNACFVPPIHEHSTACRCWRPIVDPVSGNRQNLVVLSGSDAQLDWPQDSEDEAPSAPIQGREPPANPGSQSKSGGSFPCAPDHNPARHAPVQPPAERGGLYYAAPQAPSTEADVLPDGYCRVLTLDIPFEVGSQAFSLLQVHRQIGR